MKQLNEGLRRGDLEDLVIPLISVDEYVSKVSNDAVVFGFYVNEKGAAEDLNRFIQRSPLDILDTDISGAPDQQGYYMVFVELINNETIGETFESLLDEVGELTGVENWQMHVRDYEHLIPFTTDALNRALDQETESTKDEGEKTEGKKVTNESATEVIEYLRNSDLFQAELDGDVLTLGSRMTRANFILEGICPISDVELTADANNSPNISMANIARLNRLARILGEGWIASPVGSLDGIQHIEDNRVILLRPLY